MMLGAVEWVMGQRTTHMFMSISRDKASRDCHSSLENTSNMLFKLPGQNIKILACSSWGAADQFVE